MNFFYHFLRSFRVGVANKNLTKIFVVYQCDNVRYPMLVQFIENIIQNQ